MRRDGARIQKLTVVRVSRLACNSERQRHQHCWSFVSASVCGWVILISLIVFSGLMHCWLSLSFLFVVPATGANISLSHGGKPRELRPDPPGEYNRIVVAALHMNETEWFAFYGESVLVNSLLNHKLQPKRLFQSYNWLFDATLRIFILGQWALAIGAAALQAWDAYLITFWILLCVLSHALVFPPERCTFLSGRRALLNRIIALNPSTFAFDRSTKQDIYERFYEDGLLWIDPILKRGTNRAIWEEATRRAMVNAKKKYSSDNRHRGVAMNEIEHGNWERDYKGYYWCTSILEGINMAGEVTERAGLTGRFVANEVDG
ncbi:hypothetical protein F4801DRAFT_594742 [Xylaria longipes]|nr:hypothetical protein F4801DRAFT_594742 [Xylaria longipes]